LKEEIKIFRKHQTHKSEKLYLEEIFLFNGEIREVVLNKFLKIMKLILMEFDYL